MFRQAADEARRRNTLPAIPPWSDGVRIAVNLTVAVDAMLLRRVLNEPTGQLAKGEFGGRVGLWRIIELLNEHAVKGTFFVPGRIWELYPDALHVAAEGGHEISDHMWKHRVTYDSGVERDHLLRTSDAPCPADPHDE